MALRLIAFDDVYRPVGEQTLDRRNAVMFQFVCGNSIHVGTLSGAFNVPLLIYEANAIELRPVRKYN